MFLDQDLMFSDAQLVTAAAASTNIIDLGPLFTGPPGGTNLGRDIGISDLYVFISIDTLLADAGSDSTVTVDLQTDALAAFGSQATVATIFTIPAVSVAGSLWFVKLPIEQAVPYERFIRLYFTPNGSDLTAGAISAGIIKDISKFKAYASGYSTGI